MADGVAARYVLPSLPFLPLSLERVAAIGLDLPL